MRVFSCGITALTLCAFRIEAGHAQQREAIVESVELVVPVAPAIVRIDGTQHLVYELHITNMLGADVSMSGLRVTTSEWGPNEPVAEFRDSSLMSILGRPGIRRSSPAPNIVGPGMRAVAYFWIPLRGGSLPRSVRHALELSVRRQSGVVPVTVEGGAASLSRDEPLQLDPPLREGPWVAIYDPLLMGGHRTAFYTLDGRARIPARYAIDWIRLPSSGVMDTPSAVDRNGFGADVLAVADGVVASAVDDTPDNDGPPSATANRLENASGNYVAIDIGRGRFAFYEHLKRGSVVVKAGDRVRSGQVIAQLGNSGSSSIGPHLHFHVSDANSTLAAEGLPFGFRRFEQLGAFASINALIAGEQWTPTSQREKIRQLERPAPNTVLRFP